MKRNWGVILAVIAGLLVFEIAIFAGVSELTALVRATLAFAIGLFVGVCFSYMDGASGSRKGRRTRRLDAWIAGIGGGRSESTDAAGGEMDLASSQRAILQMAKQAMKRED